MNLLLRISGLIQYSNFQFSNLVCMLSEVEAYYWIYPLYFAHPSTTNCVTIEIQLRKIIVQNFLKKQHTFITQPSFIHQLQLSQVIFMRKKINSGSGAFITTSLAFVLSSDYLIGWIVFLILLSQIFFQLLTIYALL
jgi:hypothetical protein